MRLPDRNQPRGRTIAPLSVDGSLGHPLSLSGYDGWRCGGRRPDMVFRADPLTPTGDTLLFVVPLKTSRTRRDEQGIRGREVERQCQEERQKHQMTHRKLF
jgi:hypothetical protein